MKSFIEKMANSYSPSNVGAIGLGVVMLMGSAIVAAPVAAGIGALIAGSTGAIWGAGALFGTASLLSACIVVPHQLEHMCHSYVTRQKIKNGEPTEGDLFVQAMEEAQQKNRAAFFKSAIRDFERQNKPPKDQKKQPDPNKKPKNPKPR